jgi:hypothetical protein
MSHLLAIVDPEVSEDALLEEISRRHPDRVTVLSDRAAGRLAEAIERRTGAVVVGVASSREQLRGWRFDRVVGVDRAGALSASPLVHRSH